MRRGALTHGLVAVLLLMVVAAPLATAANNQHNGPGADQVGPPLVPPKTSLAKQVGSLFDLIFWIGMVVFVLVEGLIVYVLVRFRHNEDVPTGETHRGDRRLEVAWAIVPAVILILIGGLSYQVLANLDHVPSNPDFTIGVEGSQFTWVFHYPGEMKPSYNDLYVQEGTTVDLNITSHDVIHSFWVPQFDVKISAIPGHENHQFFQTPAYERGQPNTYFFQCAEYCGVGHETMQGYIHVFPAGTQNVPFGEVPHDKSVTLRMQESPAANRSTFKWSITPTNITMKQGQGLYLTVVNPKSNNGTHQLHIEGYNITLPKLAPGQSFQYRLFLNQAGNFTYHAVDEDANNKGMWGTLHVTPSKK